eukprot:359965-Chlamydomonas_euryale.AAC.7
MGGLRAGAAQLKANRWADGWFCAAKSSLHRVTSPCGSSICSLCIRSSGNGDSSSRVAAAAAWWQRYQRCMAHAAWRQVAWCAMLHGMCCTARAAWYDALHGISCRMVCAAWHKPHCVRCCMVSAAA